MENHFKYALLSAMALMGAVSFTACSSADEVVDNPDYDPATNTVKAQLAISLPDYVGAGTRQDVSVVQGQTKPVFRGLRKIRLIPFAGEVATNTLGAQSPIEGKYFILADFDAFLNPDVEGQNAKVYTDLSVPVGTQSFMFYGEAQPSGGGDFADGVLNASGGFAADAGNFSLAPQNYKFELQPIYNETQVPEKATMLINLVKDIRNASSSVSNINLLAYLSAFMPSGGSSASVQAAIQDLWDKAGYLSGVEGDLFVLKKAIEDNGYAKVSSSGVVTLSENLSGYPEDINLPDGAAAIDWANPSSPKVHVSGNTGLNIIGLNNYVYPASLYYRANTKIGVSDNENVSYTYGEDKWDDIIGETNGKYRANGTVTSNTHSIALMDQIQYAVGRLDLKIKAESATLYDSEGYSVSVPSSGFPVSAVLVSEQRNVNWEFRPVGDVSYTIYDRVMNGSVAAKAGDFSGVNHTLVLETLPSTKEVHVAVEMTNNTGYAFRGKDGYVPAGGKFYLLGTLNLPDAKDPNNSGRDRVFEQDYITTVELTILEGTDGEENTVGLGAAYNVIPDLRTPELEVAFSVNLDWKPGLFFYINL
ncbi:MAG: hypothetical protein IJ569_03705 [Prevotella sp.]|nr:hypothetical protein [Prevotella sp.]